MEDEVKMITIRWRLSIGFSVAEREGDFEIEADASEDEIDKMIAEEAMQYVEYWRES